MGRAAFLLAAIVAVSCAAPAPGLQTQRRPVPRRRPGLGRPARPRQHERPHAEPRHAGARGRLLHPLLRQSGLFADACGTPDRPLPPAVRRLRHLPGRRAARPGRNDDRRGLRCRGLRHRGVRQVAQRYAAPLPPQRPGIRRVLRLHLGPLGELLRPAPGPQRPRRPGQRLRHRRLHRPRHPVHRRPPSRALLHLGRLQHAPQPDASARSLVGPIRGKKPPAAPP